MTSHLWVLIGRLLLLEGKVNLLLRYMILDVSLTLNHVSSIEFLLFVLLELGLLLLFVFLMG